MKTSTRNSWVSWAYAVCIGIITLFTINAVLVASVCIDIALCVCIMFLIHHFTVDRLMIEEISN